MEAVSLDSLQAISTFAPCDMYKDLRSRPSTIKCFRMDKDFEYSMRGMEKEVKASPTSLSSNILSSVPAPFDNPSDTVDPIWRQRYESEPSPSSFSSSNNSLLKSKSKGKGKTNLSKFGQYSASVYNVKATKKMTMPLSELKLKELQLISTLGKLKGSNSNKGISVTFGEIDAIVEKYSRKNSAVNPSPNPAEDSDNESIGDGSTGTSSTAESSQYDEELITVLSRIQRATSQPSLSYQFGDGLSDCDIVEVASKVTHPVKQIKEFVQQPVADQLLAIQEDSLRKAMKRQRKKESFFW